MHENSLKLMTDFKKRYVKSNSIVLDVGGGKTYGKNYGEIFSDCTYKTLDFSSDADIVVNDYNWGRNSK